MHPQVCEGKYERTRILLSVVKSFKPNLGLLKRAQAGEADALAKLYQRFGNMVFRTAYRFMRNSADADDVLQDVFLGLSTAIAKYEGRGNFEGWLKKVTVRTSLMKLRKRRLRREMSIDHAGPITALPKEMPTEDQILFEAAVATLTEEQREVFVMRAIEGYSHAEIGDMLGISSLASRSRFHRAMEQIVELCRAAR